MSRDAYLWTSANGGSTDLNSVTDSSTIGLLTHHLEGRATVKPVHVSKAIPGRAGERISEVRHGVRDLILHTVILDVSKQAVRRRAAALAAAMDPTDGDGILKVTRADDGVTRTVACRYLDGLSPSELQDGPSFARCTIALRAYDPYWYDTASIAPPLVLGQAANFFPFFPLRLSPGGGVSSPTVTNAGDVDAPPIWTITGPCSDPVLRNQTTGAYIDLTGVTLSAGDTVTIDTRTGKRTITKQDGTNLYGFLRPGSTLWWLANGANALQLVMQNAVGSAGFGLSFTQRYLGV